MRRMKGCLSAVTHHDTDVPISMALRGKDSTEDILFHLLWKKVAVVVVPKSN